MRETPDNKPNCIPFTSIDVKKKGKTGKTSSKLKIFDQINLFMLQKHLAINGLIAPEVFCNELLGLTDFGAVKFLRLKEDHDTEQYFTDIM